MHKTSIPWRLCIAIARTGIAITVLLLLTYCSVRSCASPSTYSQIRLSPLLAPSLHYIQLHNRQTAPICYNNPCNWAFSYQNRERTHDFERRRLCMVASITGKLVLSVIRRLYNYTSTMGNGQAVRHWVLVPGSGVRIPLPQPIPSPWRGLFLMLTAVLF
jgi:hypothetical protein